MQAYLAAGLSAADAARMVLCCAGIGQPDVTMPPLALLRQLSSGHQEVQVPGCGRGADGPAPGCRPPNPCSSPTAIYAVIRRAWLRTNRNAGKKRNTNSFGITVRSASG
jgi:hypothetical protein